MTDNLFTINPSTNRTIDSDDGEGKFGNISSNISGFAISLSYPSGGSVASTLISIGGEVFDQSSDGDFTIRDLFQATGALMGGTSAGFLGGIAAGAPFVATPYAPYAVAVGSLAYQQKGGQVGAEAGAAFYDYLFGGENPNAPLTSTLQHADGSKTVYKNQVIGQGGFVGNRTNIVQTVIYEYDALGNLIGQQKTVTTEVTKSLRESLDLNYEPPKCFLSDTSISMWPTDPHHKIHLDGSYDEDLVLSKAWTKPIEEIEAGDLIVSYDDKGRIQPGRVTRTMQNRATHILDFWGTGVTPGHAYLCGDGKFKGQHVPIMDILRTDGAIVRADGTLIRAATGCEVGSPGDQLVYVVLGDKQPNGMIKTREQGQLRAGTRVILENDRHYSLLELIVSNGGDVTEDGFIRAGVDGAKMPFRWTFSDHLPRPEDFILRRSNVTLDEIYAAGEWEQIGTRMPAPDGMAGVPPHHMSTLLQPSRPEPNIPPAFANHPDAPHNTKRAPNRKQRKAAEAKLRRRKVN